MELWIRSQDKEMLTKVNNLYIMNNSIWFELPFYESNKRTGLTATGHNHKLATYKSKERALEVLHKINCHIESLYNFKFGIEDDILETFTYEMPKE